jgi:hypothetical protein
MMVGHQQWSITRSFTRDSNCACSLTARIDPDGRYRSAVNEMLSMKVRILKINNG